MVIKPLVLPDVASPPPPRHRADCRCLPCATARQIGRPPQQPAREVLRG